MENIILLQLIAHILADFFFQHEFWSCSKRQKSYLSKEMYLHVFVVFIFSAILSFTFSFLLFAVFIAVTHLMIDVIKSEIEKFITRKERFVIKKKQGYNNLYIFLVDQILHIITVCFFAWIYTSSYAIPEHVATIETRYLLIILALLLCLKPANIFIRNILASLNLFPDNNEREEEIIFNNDLERAGRWIGATERILTFILTILGEFSAIGFIIAAKSILRYGDKSLRQTEYVLIGTLMSFGIAMILGLSITSGLFTTLLDWIS